MSLVASPPPVCDCCSDFPGLAEGGSEKALISLAALGSLAAAELNRRDNSLGTRSPSGLSRLRDCNAPFRFESDARFALGLSLLRRRAAVNSSKSTRPTRLEPTPA